MFSIFSPLCFVFFILRLTNSFAQLLMEMWNRWESATFFHATILATWLGKRQLRDTLLQQLHKEVSTWQPSQLFNKYWKSQNRALFYDKAHKEVTRARKRCRVNTSRRGVLLPTSCYYYFLASWVLSSLPCVLYGSTKHGLASFLFVLWYSFAHIRKEIGFNLQETSFIYSLEACARKVFSLPARAEWRHGLLLASVLW